MDIELSHYKHHKPSVVNSIQRIAEDNPDIYGDEFKAFNCLAFGLFSDAPEDAFVLTDGTNDQGIDFYTKVDNSYEVFQCKFAELGKIVASSSPLSFDDEGVTDLENGHKFLLAAHVPDTAREEIRKLRGEIMAEPYDAISFNLCIFGNLTEDASQKFEKLREKAEGENPKVTFNLYTEVVP